MNKLKQIKYKQVITNLFGVAGYNLIAVTTILTICLLGVLILQLLSSNDTIVIIEKVVSGQTGAEATTSEAARYIGYIFASIMFVLALLILIILPYQVGKYGKMITRKIVTLLRVPDNISTHYIIKAGLSVTSFLPVVIIAPFIKLDAIFEILIFIAITDFIAVIAFSLQVAIGALFKLDFQKIW
jgi:hypothetical protein